jgi:phosphoglycerate dehydrogenase-like enzyme
MPLTVYYPSIEPDLLTDLQAQLDPGVRIISGPDLPAESDYEVLITGRPTREQLAASPRLRAVVVPWAGVPETMRDLVPDFPHVEVHNLHHNADATAELAFALLLAAAKRVVPLDQKLRDGDWSARYGSSETVLLHSKTALILGYGSIGQRVARYCHALGMTLLATRRDPTKDANDDLPVELHLPDALRDLLPRAEVLVVTLPLTSETEGLIGRRELDLLPDNAILVNVGRGPIVDQQALFDALRDGRMHSAGLDVWYNYPEGEEARAHTLPADVPFHTLENIVMSPHRGGDTMDTDRLRMADLARILNAASRGEPMPNRVDLEAGY